MNLHPAGTEYVHIPISGAPATAGAMEVSFDDGTTWTTATYNADRTAISLLVSGPRSDGAGVVVTSGYHPILVRLIDTPERIIRNTGSALEVA